MMKKGAIEFPLLLTITIILIIAIAAVTFYMLTGSDVARIIDGTKDQIIAAFERLRPDFLT